MTSWWAAVILQSLSDFRMKAVGQYLTYAEEQEGTANLGHLFK